jgi:ankyrin repeat protein
MKSSFQTLLENIKADEIVYVKKKLNKKTWDIPSSISGDLLKNSRSVEMARVLLSTGVLVLRDRHEAARKFSDTVCTIKSKLLSKSISKHDSRRLTHRLFEFLQMIKILSFSTIGNFLFTKTLLYKIDHKYATFIDLATRATCPGVVISIRLMFGGKRGKEALQIIKRLRVGIFEAKNRLYRKFSLCAAVNANVTHGENFHSVNFPSQLKLLCGQYIGIIFETVSPHNLSLVLDQHKESFLVFCGGEVPDINKSLSYTVIPKASLFESDIYFPHFFNTFVLHCPLNIKFLAHQIRNGFDMNFCHSNLNNGNTVCMTASENADICVVKILLLYTRVDVSLVNNFGNTVLHIAAFQSSMLHSLDIENISRRHKCVEIMRTVLHFKPDSLCNEQNYNRETPIFLACTSSTADHPIHHKLNYTAISVLLKHGADVNVIDINSESILHKLAKCYLFHFSDNRYNNQIKISLREEVLIDVCALLQEILPLSNCIYAQNSNGRTALMEVIVNAPMQSDISVIYLINIFLRHTHSLCEHRDHSGHSAVSLAISLRKYYIVDLLNQKYGDCIFKGMVDFTPLKQLLHDAATFVKNPRFEKSLKRPLVVYDPVYLVETGSGVVVNCRKLANEKTIIILVSIDKNKNTRIPIVYDKPFLLTHQGAYCISYCVEVCDGKYFKKHLKFINSKVCCVCGEKSSTVTAKHYCYKFESAKIDFQKHMKPRDFGSKPNSLKTKASLKGVSLERNEDVTGFQTKYRDGDGVVVKPQVDNCTCVSCKYCFG